MAKLSEVRKTDWYRGLPRKVKASVRQFPPECVVVVKKSGVIAHVDAYDCKGRIQLLFDQADNMGMELAQLEPYVVGGYELDELEFVCER